MNCKEGDLARVISGSAAGALVQVGAPFDSTTWYVIPLQFTKGWNIFAGQKTVWPGQRGCICSDRHLRPLPPDELASWATEQQETADATPA